ncbi:MAG: hypothetical protein RL113_646 [Pseudomonadota bacterium]|jgi:uncharacterized protein YehS (DUF1456 family)
MHLTPNEILYRIQQALNLSQNEILETYKLESYPMDANHLDALLKRRQDKDFIEATYEELGVFLDGFVTLKRGASSQKKEENSATELTNNLILKKLRIALELKEAETEIIFGLADVTLTKQQLSSLFRKEDHKNFKPCSDELLVAFLEGLDEFYYSGEEI